MTTTISIQKRPLPPTLGTIDGFARASYKRKTARGKVLSVVRERYLRDDVACGVRGCTAPACAAAARVPEAAARLIGKEGRRNKGVNGAHVLVIDTNVALHQMDLLESTLAEKPATSAASGSKSQSQLSFTHVIVPQTVLDEVRHRSLPLYNRLSALIDEDGAMWTRFWNEAARETATVRNDDETPNDQNDRAIRLVVQYYRQHLARFAKLDVVLLTDDADNARKAKAEGSLALSVREYVAGMARSDELLDLLSTRSLDGTHAADGEVRKSLYEAHLAPSALEAGVRAGTLHSGFFNASQFNVLEGTVRCQGLEKPILIRGREAMNRAVDGDIVAVRLLPKSEWRAEADEVREAAGGANDDAGSEDGSVVAVSDDEEDEEPAAENKQKQSEAGAKATPQPTGRIVGITRRNWRSYVCVLDARTLTASALSSLGSTSLLALPVDRKVPRIRVRTRQAAQLMGQKILVALDEWRETSRYPDGHFVRALGATESKEAEQESLLLEHDVPYRPFSRAILDCLPVEGESWKVPPKEQGGPAWRDRVDMRDQSICSIDPPGCQDIDDALHARRLPNGNIETGVHIADVSYFVKADTPMDAEAASRGTTVYLVDKRIDMLPHLLGTNLCSLRPFVERLAFSAIWEMTPDADIVGVRFHKSVIASKAAFTYEEAQLRKDDASKTDDITQSIRLLNEMAIKLKAKRMAAGALNLASPEVRIHLDSSESAGPIDVEQKEQRETNSLVEEFMLLANCSVAERCYEAFPQTAVLRRHAPPPRTNFETLQDILRKRRGMDLDVSSSGALAASLDRCVDPNEPAFNTLLRIMATRCMLSAEYFCSGSVARDSFAHYGLAVPMYTHFTSPIRRYADVLAHRQLAAAIEYDGLHPSLHSKTHVDTILSVVNKRHRSAQMAGRASVEYWVGLAIAKKNEEAGGSAKVGTGEVKLREEAFVIRAFRNGVAVFVSKFGLEGLITFKEDCEFDAEQYTVKVPASVSGLKRDLSLGIFDRVQVEIGTVKDKNTQRGRVQMGLL